MSNFEETKQNNLLNDLTQENIINFLDNIVNDLSQDDFMNTENYLTNDFMDIIDNSRVFRELPQIDIFKDLINNLVLSDETAIQQSINTLFPRDNPETEPFNNFMNYIAFEDEPNYENIIELFPFDEFENNTTIVNIYNDNQNVHNSCIQICLSRSINNVLLYSSETKLDEETLKEEILNDDVLEESIKMLLLEYIEIKDIHSVIKCSFGDLLIQVWRIIKDNLNKNEIKNILNTEMKDSIGKCFTGRISRLINVLNGYSDLVDIKISDTEQKNIIMSLAINKYKSKEEIEEFVRNEFNDRNFDDVDTWLNFLDEL